MHPSLSKIEHTLPPVCDAQSKVLILGTMPSPKSREAGFYYSHPQNRFWPVMARLLDAPLPRTNDDKRALMLSRHIALWDVLSSCLIAGADDSSILAPVPNDIAGLLARVPVKAVFTTGTKAASLYRRLVLPQTGVEATALPSTSPANCRYHNLDTLTEAYRVILSCLK